jgi:hypothetical protein
MKNSILNALKIIGVAGTGVLVVLFVLNNWYRHRYLTDRSLTV